MSEDPPALFFSLSRAFASSLAFSNAAARAVGFLARPDPRSFSFSLSAAREREKSPSRSRASSRFGDPPPFSSASFSFSTEPLAKRTPLAAAAATTAAHTATALFAPMRYPSLNTSPLGSGSSGMLASALAASLRRIAASTESVFSSPGR